MDTLFQRVRAALADRYEVESEIGRGGMAIVYRGQDRRHGRSVAIKVLPPHLASAVGHERFLQEIQVSAGLSHPYVLPLLDSGQADGLLYYVMPFVEGESLAEKISLEGPLPVEDVLRIALEVCEALGYAHDRGIVHRDVKPSNILLTHEHAILTDFGVAFALRSDTDERLTGTGMSVGTPAYMSPQQGFAEEGVDGSGDQYSLACVIYEMATGAPPYVGPTSDAIFRSHALDPIPDVREARPAVPAAAGAALAKAMSKSPEDRFPSMQEFAKAFGSSESAPGASRGGRWVAVVALVLAAVAAAMFLPPNEPVDPMPDVAINHLAFLPCQAVDAADADLARNVANAVSLGLNGWPIRVTTYQQSEAWAAGQAARDIPLSDSIDAALDRLRARTLGVCEIAPAGPDSIEVSYRLYEGPRDVSLHRIRVARTSERTVNADPLIGELVGLVSDGSIAGGSTFRPTENNAALQYFYLADEAFRNDRLFLAEHYFGLAADTDTAFALARWRQADARRWRAVPGLAEIDLDRLFNESSDRLGRRDSLLLWALTEPPGPGLFARFDTVLAEIPDDAYATLLYGDELLHRGALWGVMLDSAEVVLERSTGLNPRFAPTWDHLAQVRIRLGQEEAADEAVRNLERLASGVPPDEVEMPFAMIWRHGWLERFDPDSADANRPRLQADIGLLGQVARLVRYADLPRAQFELGMALVNHDSSPPGSEQWHSGLNATALAQGGLGRPAAAGETFSGVAGVDAASALFADEWAVVPYALGLEGFPAGEARQASARLFAIAENPGEDGLRRARAAWALALLADAEGAASQFADLVRVVLNVAATEPRAAPLTEHLQAVAHARAGRLNDALATSRSLIAYDSIGNTDRPFGRAAFYLHRGAWFEAAGQPDSAVAAWSWYLNTDLETIEPRAVQASEVDGALGSHARLRIARLGAASEDAALSSRACFAASEVARRWSEAEPALTEAVAEVARILEGCRE